jgi:hypothetical protein
VNEFTHMALPAVLDRLESYACYELGRKVIPSTGSIRLFGRNAHIGRVWANVEVTFFESLDGLEVRMNGQCVAVLKNYRSFKQMAPYRWQRELPRALHFEPVIRPRIAGAS